MNAGPVALGWVGDRAAFGDVEHAFFACLEIDVVAGGDGQRQDTLVDAVEVDLDDGQFLFVLLFLARGFVFFVLRRLVVGVL